MPSTLHVLVLHVAACRLNASCIDACTLSFSPACMPASCLGLLPCLSVFICFCSSLAYQTLLFYMFSQKTCNNEHVCMHMHAFESNLIFINFDVSLLWTVSGLGINPCMCKQKPKLNSGAFFTEWCTMHKIDQGGLFVSIGLAQACPNYVQNSDTLCPYCTCQSLVFIGL